VSLQGASELRARLKAIKLTFKGYGKTWADETASEMRSRVPVDTGRLKGSIRRKSATQRKAVVVGHYTANFVDAGSKAHDIVPKSKPRLIFETGGRTIFTKKVHKARIAARRFKRPAALAAIRKHPISEALVDRWNRAA
jgi:hypothetical protein